MLFYMKKRYKGVNRLTKDYKTQVLTNVEIDEIVKMGGEISNIDEGIVYKEYFKISPFKNVIEHLFVPKLKYEEAGNNLMVELKINYELFIWTIKTTRY